MENQEDSAGFWARSFAALSSIFLPISVFSTAILYFTGNSFLNAKAKALGLASAPSSITLQDTLAVGASVILTRTGLWVLISAIIVVFLLQETAAVFIRRLARFPKRLDLWPKQEWVELARGAAHLMPLPLYFAIIVNLGRMEGESEAQRIRETVSGSCKACSVISRADVVVRGLIAFNDQQGLIVAHKDGLTILPYGEPISAIIVRPRVQGASQDPVPSNPSPKNQTTTAD